MGRPGPGREDVEWIAPRPPVQIDEAHREIEGSNGRLLARDGEAYRLWNLSKTQSVPKPSERIERLDEPRLSLHLRHRRPDDRPSIARGPCRRFPRYASREMNYHLRLARDEISSSAGDIPPAIHAGPKGAEDP